MFFKKKKIKKEYDKEKYNVVIHQSICTGEMVIGFEDKKTKEFIEMSLIKDNIELNKFLKEYDIDINTVKKVY